MHNIFTYQLIAVLLWDKNTASKVKLETSIFLKQWYRVYSNIHIWRYFQLLTWAEMFVMTLLTCATVPVSLSIYHHPIIITCGHSLASVRQQTLSSHPLTPKTVAHFSCFSPSLLLYSNSPYEQKKCSCTAARWPAASAGPGVRMQLPECWSRAVLKKGACMISKNLARKKTQGQKSRKAQKNKNSSSFPAHFVCLPHINSRLLLCRAWLTHHWLVCTTWRSRLFKLLHY